jgi:putative aldouronate transport system substrate-binding protein
MDRILQLYDYLLTDEGSFMINFGFEGEDYEIQSDGNIRLKDGINLWSKYVSTHALSFLVRWNPNLYDERYAHIDPNKDQYVEVNMAKIEEARTEGKLYDFDLRYTYLSTPLKNDFTFTYGEDLMTIMLGTEPVEKMWNDILQKYKDKGLDEMIAEVNQYAKDKGWQ